MFQLWEETLVKQGLVMNLVAIGKVVRIDLLTHNDEQTHHLWSPALPGKNWWFAWEAKSRDILIVKTIDIADVPPDAVTAKKHRLFHGEKSERMLEVDWRSPRRLAEIGLIDSITYDVRHGGFDTDKDDAPYRHVFGDFGRAGKGDKSDEERYKPALAVDVTTHRLYIVRRPGNAFSLGEWLIG